MAKKKDQNIIAVIRGLWASFASGKGNAKTIFLCLVTAFIFWFFNSLNNEYTTRLDYPVAFNFNKDSLISKTDLPSQISINVTGGGWNLLRKTIGFSVEPLKINLESVPVQSYLTEFSLLTLASDQLEELTVNYIISDTIFVDIDVKSEKSFKVYVDTSSLSLAKNHLVVSDISISPDSIKLVGPQSEINAIGEVLNLVIPDTDIDDNYDETIPVSLSTQPKITSYPEKVEVTFSVEPFVTYQRKVKIERLNFPDKKVFLLSNASANLSAYLPASKVEELDTMNIIAVADYEKLNMQDSTIILKPQRLPEYIIQLEFEDPSVKIIYQ